MYNKTVDESQKSRVKIEGKPYTLPMSHIQAERMEQYVNRVIDGLKQDNAKSMIDVVMRAHLIGVTIANDYFRAKDQLEEQAENLRQLTADKILYTANNEDLTAKVATLETELANVKGEFQRVLEEYESFLESFDNRTAEAEAKFTSASKAETSADNEPFLTAEA